MIMRALPKLNDQSAGSRHGQRRMPDIYGSEGWRSSPSGRALRPPFPQRVSFIPGDHLTAVKPP